MLRLCKGKFKTAGSLEALRHSTYRVKLKGKRAVQLRHLPPTSKATAQHALRIHLQVQEWMGNPLEPIGRGWVLRDGLHIPNPGYSEICPSQISKVISCKCKGSCSTASCGCFKIGAACTSACGCGDECCNLILEYEIEDEGEDEEDTEDEECEDIDHDDEE